jgi:cell division protein FtsB
MREMGASLSFILPLGLLMFAIVCVPLRLAEPEGLPRYRALKAERAEVQAKNEQLKSEVRELQARVQRLKTAPEALERIARDELGMLRKDELLFQFRD